MKQRINTGIILFLIILTAFLLRSVEYIFFDTFIALAVVVATAEVSRVFIRSGKDNFMELGVIYAIVVYLTLMWGINSSFDFSSYLLSQSIILAFFFALSFTISYVTKRQLPQATNKRKLSDYEYSIRKSLTTLFIMVYPALILSFLYLVNNMSSLRLSSVATTAFAGVDIGLLVLIMIFFTTISTDTLAYFGGKTIGGKKLAPLISPKKTISGAIVGIIGSVLASLLTFAIFYSISIYNVAFFQAEITIWHFLAYGVLASIISQIGDLFASAVKRKARAKDFSTLFPGHGGVMDRLDGVSFNTVFTFLFVLVFFL
jgi:CDP-diglyceride synthetase